SPRTIWLEKNGVALLNANPFPDPDFDACSDSNNESKFDYSAPEATPETTSAFENRARADLYSFGCTLFRIIAGKTPFSDVPDHEKPKVLATSAVSSLAKYELPAELATMLESLLAKQPSDRPNSASQVAGLLGLLSGKAAEIEALTMPKSKPRLIYRKSLVEIFPGSSSAQVATTPNIQTNDEPEPQVSPEVSEARMAKIKIASEAANQRKRNRWKTPVAIGAGLLAISAITGVLLMNANKKVATKPADSKDNTTTVQDPLSSDNDIPIAEVPVRLRPIVFQKLIEDDDQTLWETPTVGPPMMTSYLPPSAKMLFTFRPADLVATDEGNRVIKSLGPKFETRLKQLQDELGLDLEHIERLTVSLHTNETFEYESYFIVETVEPILESQMIQNWNRPVNRVLDNQQSVLDTANGQSAYYIIHDSRDLDQESTTATIDTQQNPDLDQGTSKSSSETVTAQEQQISKFAFGPQNLVDEVALNVGASILPASLANVASWTDQNRHVNILFLRTSLFNEEGQKLMGLDNISFNRELGVMVPDNVRGGLLSLHLDNGTYVELMLDKNVDLKAADLKSVMAERMRQQRDNLMGFIARIPASPYWDNVRIRYGGMLANFYRNIRWDVENKQVVANCWLPPMAAHNLLAASEHALSFSSGTSSSAQVATSTGPQTLDELLAIKRDLNIANPPDLNVLMADIQSEISDDFPRMPFEFNIRLLGADLEKEGITKNQRPSELLFKQVSIAEILTSIMTLANPSKDITGPSDPECKLIWVVADDPQKPGQKAILVTTRKAAAEKSYILPPAFRSE
ncbi:MAG: serine/threonine protein kinase, partial [Mariniblastus sp.]